LNRRGRSSGDWKKVDAARALAADALGRERPAPSKPPPKPTKLEPPSIRWEKPGPSIGVLTVGEAAQRIGISRQDLEARIARGEVQTLPVGSWGMVVVPTSEVERLRASTS
jgi:hypothetical protein